MRDVSDDSASSVMTVNKWSAKFKGGRASFENGNHNEWPKSATTLKIINKVPRYYFEWSSIWS